METPVNKTIFYVLWIPFACLHLVHASFCINYYELLFGFSSVLDCKLNTVLGTMPYIQVSINMIFNKIIESSVVIS